MSNTPASSQPSILQIAVATPVGDVFDYLPISELKDNPLPGCRVLVPFGHREVVGVLVNVSSKSSIDVARLKPILKVIDQIPALQTDQLELAKWANRYYHHPLGEIVQSMLPATLRQGKSITPKLCRRWQSQRRDEASNLLTRAPKQKRLYDAIANEPDGLNETQLGNLFRVWRPLIRELDKKGLLKVSTEHISLTYKHKAFIDSASIELTKEQKRIVGKINESPACFKAWLLDGVTGSGKTEVYMHVIKHALANNKQCLVLVPEIGLTPQLIDRLSSQLTTPVPAWHSGLTDQQRHQIWYAAANGDAEVIVGTRSAVFLPLARPGLIIIDEEHDSSLKQQDGFRYHARDLAIVRARQLCIPVVLGSATPSLESLNNTRQGRYIPLHLRQRAGGAQLPKITLLDIHNAKASEVLSQVMLKAIESHLNRGAQVLLFLNRRGYAPLLLCNECDWKSECPRCDTYMTLHQREQLLRCHHCGHEEQRPRACPGCQAASMQTMGTGTEQLEQYLNTHFPEHSVLRIDRDAVKRKGTLEQHLAQARSGKADILLGTQMLSKGHHFPNVTLVCILGIDQALFSADFRGPEYMAQQIIQVAGRAGRAEQKGEVLIETRLPQHPLLRLLVSEGYEQFAEAALAERESAGLPPFSYLVLARAEAVSAETALRFLDQLTESLKTKPPSAVQLLGPVPAPMERRAGRYRAQLLLQSTQRSALQNAAATLRQIANSTPLRRQVRWSIDVDPMEML